MKQEGVEKAEVPEGAQLGRTGLSEVPVAKTGVSGSVVAPHPAQRKTVSVRLGPQCCACVLALSAGRCMGSPTCYHSSFSFVLLPPQFKKIADFKGNI